MPRKGLRLLAAFALAAFAAVICWSGSPVVEHGAAVGFTAHEWGTFTSVAGPDGQAVAWLPLLPSTDLPPFVEHLRNENYKCSLSESVRMETPVLYLYSPRETTVSVNVSFTKGTLTEWYPHASAVERNDTEGRIRWNPVRLLPGSEAPFPSGPDNPYYAARHTAATPLRVNAPHGHEDEKFLFYRGVSSAALPIAAQLTPDGQVLVRNLGANEIPAVMLIESRNGKLGYRALSRLHDEARMDPPPLTANEPVKQLDEELEAILVARGLYEDEARAMIATWRNSWFEEGSRLLYIMPAPAVNSILPLAIRPAPSSTVRVFVGRLELITPATENAVEQAFAAHDEAQIDKYRRFLVPVLNGMIAAAQQDPGRAKMLRDDLNSAYSYACASAKTH